MPFLSASVVPLPNDFTASYTDKKEGLFYKNWVWLLHHFLITTIHHCYDINLSHYQHGDNGIWMVCICSVTRTNMDYDVLLSNDCLSTQKQWFYFTVVVILIA